MRERKFTKTALAISICLLIIWGILGTGTSIAWFTDESPVVKNTFDFGELDLVVSHKVGNEWVEIDEETAVFDDEALYEPGYTQVVYLKIENKGDVNFDYKMSVDMISFTPGVNEIGQPIYLPNYLKFEAVIAKDESTLTREVARTLADKDLDSGDEPSAEMLPLNTYSSKVGKIVAEAGEDSVDYAALILYMPEHVGNEANYRGSDIPTVELGITVHASQEGTISE